MLTFWYASNPKWNNCCHLFTAHLWTGELQETEEMLPRWWDMDALPFDQMWSDDIIWLPDILGHNEEINYTFWFNEKDELEKWKKDA